MIIVSDAYGIESAIDADNPRIGYQSHLRDLALTASSIAVSSEDAEGPRDAPLRESTDEFWEPTALPATWEATFPSGVDVNYVGILGFNLDGIAVLVETSDGSPTGSPATLMYEEFASDLIPENDAPIMLLDALRSITRLRITLSAASTPDEMPKLVSIYAGEVLEVQRPVYGGLSPLSLSRDTTLYAALSQGGQLLRQAFKSHGQVGSLPLKNLTAAWVRAELDPFIQHARSRPYFMAWRPETYPLETAYVWTTTDIRPANTGPRDFMSVTIPMRGIGHE